MAAPVPPWAADLLHVWFARLRPEDWFARSDAVDAMLTARFADNLQALRNRPASAFLGNPRLALAAILLFDQISRNIYRGTPQAFAFDGKAALLARAAIDRGLDESFSARQRQFVAMPLMHSEDIQDQRRSLGYFGAHVPANLPFARRHHAMIARFGRFPHRNAILGRVSTRAELKAIDRGFSW